MIRFSALIFCLALLMPAPTLAQVTESEYPRWVEQMKASPRGPFSRIRWFCNDGTVLPPKPYACREHDGGVQHGQWSDRTQELRDKGFRVANVLAAVNADTFLLYEDPAFELSQMVLERFLMTADDGWIFRGARTYRGALQVENEEDGGYRLLTTLLHAPDWRRYRYPLVREAARWLPHGVQHQTLTSMRQLARTLAEADPGFESYRAKLHILPEPSDLERIVAYTETAPLELSEGYAQLVEQLEQIYQQPPLEAPLTNALRRLAPGPLKTALQELLAVSASDRLPLKLERGAKVLAQLRQRLTTVSMPRHMLQLIDLSLLIEGAWFQWSTDYLLQINRLTRQELLTYLRWQAQALYGSGLIHLRQQQAMIDTIGRLQRPLAWYRYKEHLDYLARAADWSGRTLEFFFSPSIDRWKVIEPLVIQYLPDRLRGSLLAPYMRVVERLQIDADRALGVRHAVFGREVAVGIRALNPGLARGRLQIPRSEEEPLARDAIVVLPETREDLPPVAGILTEGEGNALSHIQLLARNLGLPNVRLAPTLRPRLNRFAGMSVVLAVSPAGRVILEEDAPRWDAAFVQKAREPQVLIEPDLHKLNLQETRLLTLDQLRAVDSGRIVGPKAANLGELKTHYPSAVPQGLVLPFGLFRQLLDQPFGTGPQSTYQWLTQQYRMLEAISDPAARDRATAAMLERVRDWMAQVEFPQDLERQLRAALESAFGVQGSYGVFVRSDTNVEDLPGFTGAGLNKTVPHVVGFDAIVNAIRTVWASPFSDRAFRWRQGHMSQPEHVYASVLLQLSVDADKSGVLVTADVANGRRDRLTVAISEGVGGAVAGQRAEELLIYADGRVQPLAQAAEPRRRHLRPQGGLAKVAALAPEAVLTANEVRQLRQFAAGLSTTFPLPLLDGKPVIADVEFGFDGGRFVLFQIRPFVESRWARQSQVLQALDQRKGADSDKVVPLNRLPEVE